MIRILLISCLLAGGAQAEIKSVAQAEEMTLECDTCLARQNGKRALRDYLAKKRAEEKASDKDNE